MKKKVSEILIIILSLLAAIGPKTIFPVCNGAMKMRCQDTAQAELIVGLLAACIGAGLIFVAKKKIRLILLALAVVSGIFIILIPTALVGVCGSPMMHCVTVTRPALIVTGTLLILVSAVSIFLTLGAASSEV